jgi:hypothetical protein
MIIVEYCDTFYFIEGERQMGRQEERQREYIEGKDE